MTYEEFCKQGSFSLEDLLAFAYGNLVDDRPDGFDARLPAPPFLMLDRILTITSEGRQGRIVAEQDIRLDACISSAICPATRSSRVASASMPSGSCSILFASGGCIGCRKSAGMQKCFFNGQIRPYNRCVRYEVDIRRFSHLKDSGASIVIGDAKVFVDNELITEITQAQTGVFSGIVYPDYPKHSRNSVGGMIRS
jgi:3-hydroxyacyl-[acyl-carrier protein] dehydratase/trans-2-decenoyl-[acyl-carrier protein] isomerase